MNSNFWNSTFKRKVKAEYSLVPKDKEKARLRRSGFKPVAKRMARSRPKPDEQQWAKAVREQDNYTCRWPECGYYSLKIHAHHVHTRRQRPDLVLEVSNGATICPKHHDYIHHTLEGRRRARELGLLGTETYELANKRKAAA